GLIALVMFRRRLLGERRDVAVSLCLCALAPLAVLTLTQLVAPPRYGEESSGLLTFAGRELLLDWRRLTEFSWTTWSNLFAGGFLARPLPGAVALMSVALTGYLLIDKFVGLRAGVGRGPLSALLLFYWIPIAIILAGTDDAFSRYLLHIHPLSLVWIAVVVGWLASSGTGWAARRAWLTLVPPFTASGCLLLLGIHFSSALAGQWASPVVDADYYPSLRYVAERQLPGEPIIVALPAAAYLVLPNREDIRFLAGQEGQERVERYTHLTKEGRTVDYWIGAESIVSRAGLCATLRRHPGAWVIVDVWRLRQEWAYAGDFATIIQGMTTPLDVSSSGVLVARVAPPELRTTEAVNLCLEVEAVPRPVTGTG
nr:hypothetical protein [Chloroflexota bacterium]